MSTKNLKLKKFLKNRGLYEAYKTDKKIKYKTKHNIEVSDEKVQVVVYKKGKETIVANRYDYKELTRAKNKTTNQVLDEIKTNKRPVDYIGIRRFKNYDVERSQVIRRKSVGRVWLRITFYKGKNKQTVEADNGFTVPLVSKNERGRAEKKAFDRCRAQLEFYEYDNFEILNREYLYVVPRGLRP